MARYSRRLGFDDDVAAGFAIFLAVCLGLLVAAVF
jgi:hypothetical protein